MSEFTELAGDATIRFPQIDAGFSLKRDICAIEQHRLAKARQLKWDLRYLKIAREVASWSKDPSTKTGAFIADGRMRPVSFGFNGMPQRVQDSHDRLHTREIKYETIIHCEVNAGIFAGRDLTGCTLYTYPFMSCSRCASQMIQWGITRHVAPRATDEQLTRWGKAFDLSTELFKEAGVEVVLIDPILLSDEKQASRA